MIKAVLLSFALAFAITALPGAGKAASLGGIERVSDDLSSARKNKARSTRRARARHGRRVIRRGAGAAAVAGTAGGAAAGPRRQGESECGGDARRLCRSVLSQGDFAVLGCFKARARFLSRGCRALLVSYGQL